MDIGIQTGELDVLDGGIHADVDDPVGTSRQTSITVWIRDDLLIRPAEPARSFGEHGG